jgi:hypothetical protein
VTSDHFAVRVVTGALAIAALSGIGLMGYMAASEIPIPDQFDRVVTLVVGALIALLSRTSSSSDPQSVVGEDGGPVEVAEVSSKAKRRVLRAR